MENNRKAEREIEISAIISLVVRKAGLILIVALYLMCSLGFYQANLQKQLVANSQNAQDSEEQEQLDKDYKKACADYRKNLNNTEFELAGLRQDVANEEEYLRDSLLMNLNPYDYYTTTIFVSIADLDEEALNERLGETTNLRDYLYNKICDRYVMLTTGLDYAQDLKIAKYQTSRDKYVRELIDVTNYGQGDLCIIASEETEKDSRNLAMAVYDFVVAQNETVAKGLYAHNLVLDSCVTKNVIDDELISDQQECREKLTKTTNRIEELEHNLEDLTEPKREDYICSSEEHQFSKAAVVKYCILGFFGGALIVALVVVVDGLLRWKYLTTYEIEKENGLKCLGTLMNRNPFFAKLAARVASDRNWKRGEAESYLTAQMETLLGEREHVLVASSVALNAKKIRRAKEIFEANGRRTVTVIPHFNENPETFSALDSCDSIILAEKIAKSNSKEVAGEVSAIRNSGKEILGFVTI